MTQPKDIEGLRKVAEALPAWARGAWEIDLDASADFFSVRTTLDGDVDGDTGQHIVVGGDQITAIPDVSCDDAIAEFIATFDPPTVLALLSELEAVKGENRRLREACGFGAARFRHYADLHAAKGTPDGDAKAQANIGAAETLEAALASLKEERGSSSVSLRAAPDGANETQHSAGKRLHGCWQQALLPHTATGENVAWDDFDAEQQVIWDDAARLFLAAAPLSATDARAMVRDGLITLSVAVDALPAIVSGSCCCNALDGLWKVTDPEAFAKEVCHALNDEREDGTTPVHMMFDKAFMHAIEQGGEGIEECNEAEFERIAATFNPLPVDHGASSPAEGRAGKETRDEP